jgi:polyphosphate kinase 2 (PPK2 family)
MMEKTSLKRARWHLVPANDKPCGRIAVFTILRPLDTKVAEMAKQLFDLD